MKIVKLKGGLGNQMFQYAYAKLVEKRTGEETKIDMSAYGSLKNDTVRVPRISKFNISLPYASEDDLKSVCKLKHSGNSLSVMYKAKIFLESKLNKKYYFEPHRGYISPDSVLKHDYMDGYWQSYQYIEEMKDVLEREFTPNYELSQKTKDTIAKVESENSVFIGVRKGDYTAKKRSIARFGSFTSEYYLAAMDKIAETVENPVFYVFSNDVEWCKNNLDWGKYTVNYREPEQQTSDFEELMIMSSCKHAIIVNSTFNWWGAYMIKNPEKIICCPKKWAFDDSPCDMIPPKWTKIDK